MVLTAIAVSTAVCTDNQRPLSQLSYSQHPSDHAENSYNIDNNIISLFKNVQIVTETVWELKMRNGIFMNEMKIFIENIFEYINI